MSNRHEYMAGQEVGLNGIIYLKELEPKGSRKTRRRALFECPFCKSSFAAAIDNIKTVNSTQKSCGCYRRAAAIQWAVDKTSNTGEKYIHLEQKTGLYRFQVRDKTNKLLTEAKCETLEEAIASREEYFKSKNPLSISKSNHG
jgi:hypothetical protein